MNLRAATADDARTIAAVHVASRQAAYAHFVPVSILASVLESYRTVWRARVQETQKLTLVGELSGRVVGFIRFGPGDLAPAPQVGVLEYLYLSPEFWDQGLGKQLLKAAEAGLAKMGYSSACLAVYELNERARSFYERNGWVFDGTRWEIDFGGPVGQMRYVKDVR